MKHRQLEKSFKLLLIVMLLFAMLLPLTGYAEEKDGKDQSRTEEL